MAVIALLGSGEFEPWARTVDTWCAEHATASSDRVLVVPTASAPEGEDVFERWASMGLAHYRAIGLAPEVVELRTREDAFVHKVVDAVADARLIFFSGGNPGYLCETLQGTPFWEAVVDAVSSGTALGGCSAGAVAMGTIAPFVAADALHHWVGGLKLLPKAHICPHFDQLDNYAPGLRSTMLSMRPEGTVSVGIDENTALYGDDAAWHVAGSLGVWVGDESSDQLVRYGDGDPVPVRLGPLLT